VSHILRYIAVDISVQTFIIFVSRGDFQLLAGASILAVTLADCFNTGEL